MSDRIWHQEPPLTDSEQAQRLDQSTRIQIEHSYSRPVIRREWVLGKVDDMYGYAEKRSIDRFADKKLDLIVPGVLDVTALTAVILAELQRQAATERG